MKQQLHKKLSTFIITAMLFSASANAQIVYTDVNPDTSMICSSYPCGKTYSLDLNNDGTVDFTLGASHQHLTCQFQNYSDIKSVSITSQSGNLAAATPLTANYSIGSNLSFSTNNVVLRTVASGSGGPGCPVGTTSGSWTSTSDRYLGLQITIGSNTYYGWVQLNVVVDQFVSTVSCTVKDYAYNSVPNQSILAGQTVATGIAPLSLGDGLGVRLFPNPAKNQLTINSEKLKVKNVSIYDLTGREVYTENHHTSNANSEIKIDVSKFPAGVYAVQIQTVDFTTTKKLVIEK